MEQHDVFFGIATSLKELAGEMEAFWPDSGKLHIDAWREVTVVEGFQIQVVAVDKSEAPGEGRKNKLFFINLGGYQPFRFEEQHYMLLTIKSDKASAIKEAKKTLFFQTNHSPGASSHIDDKYGIDVDELYEIEEILPPTQRGKFRINISLNDKLDADEIHLGYLKMSLLKK
ncbi:DUF1543 domain-containing protein [Dyadobacter sandarakinus]|uniref:DUF1543 domain-containing protein n=1 Tax=Dyadobacter sandarakinus TaxID=2747268 RepID=UPI00195A4FB6|nr:DUF1543 domain-containing protein [Dyadobacter sandarakinus]